MNIEEKLEESIENKYMKDDKGKNKMELTIEESVYILKRKDFNTYVEDKAIETLLTAYEKEKEKKKKIDEFCRKELAFERRLKRENREPDEFNQGRFYVSENIRKIIEEE